MTRLLLFAFVLLAGSARAVDYVKCEAIQKAGARVRASRNEFLRSLSSPKLQEIKSSLAYGRSDDDPPYVVKAWEYIDRQNRIAQDYSDEGCY